MPHIDNPSSADPSELMSRAKEIADFCKPFKEEVASKYYYHPTKRNEWRTTAEKIRKIQEEWPTEDWGSEINDAPESYEKAFKQELRFKQHASRLAQILTNGREPELLKLATQYVQIWGGVGGNKDETLKSHVAIVRKIEQVVDVERAFENKELKFAGISSWSKILELLHPEWGIYDSRVAFTINAVNYLNGSRRQILPSPPTQNSYLARIDLWTLMLLEQMGSWPKGEREAVIGTEKEPSRIPASQFQKKFQMPKQDVYPYFLKLIKAIHEELYGKEKHIVITEMLLFGLATSELADKVLIRATSRQS